MTVIKDLLDLPERVRRGDFVLKLSEGVTRADETVNNYVVTPQLAASFDLALDLIKAGVKDNTSKGCYLHGSFGSGKSHFMAILNLILQGNAKARSIPELSSTIAKHNSWSQQLKFLLIPYHMIGKESMEQAILGGYVDFIQQHHPESKVPGIYRSDELLKDAANLRTSLGDEKFFNTLNEGNITSDDGWGTLSTGWTAESYEAAAASPARTDEKSRLIGDLVEHFFSSAKNASEFVDLDTGLSLISKHAKSIGYDAVVLFLDELILWLASRAADLAFINREGPKVSKLIEAQVADRPIPLISFVARQRDLKELVGDSVTGAQYLSFSDTLDWWEARFAKIKLEDKNLPAIAEKRVLKPKSDAAKKQIDDAFNETSRIRQDVLNVLLTSKADKEMFRKIYPFSPAFMDTLVAMSFLLQRERTALKVMLQILIDQKETLKLGEIIPVGDLFDAISEGDEAVSDDIRRNFVNARKLYEEKLRPILERNNGITFDDIAHRPDDDPTVKNLRNEDRLIKTLLLGALAPNVEALRGITASQLAALNHGTIQSPIPGHEYQIVLNKCRKWASEVGQIKVGDEPTNPTISIQLSGVDTESIIDQAKIFDNTGNRIREVRKLIFQSFGIDDADGLFLEHEFSWRGTPRKCRIQFENVRKKSLESLKNATGNWLVIIDYPFDEDPGHHGPRDDIAKINTFLDEFPEGSLTLAIIPSFLSNQSLKALGQLVIINNVLKGENFKAYTNHLSPSDQQVAKTLLENQQSQLRQQILRYLDCAYGITSSENSALDEETLLEEAEHYQSLTPGFEPKPPAAANLKAALAQLLDQALESQFPGHPRFDDDIKLSPTVIKKVFAEIEKSCQISDGRTLVERPLRRDVKMIANPLKLGSMEETHFILGHSWKNHFQKMMADNDEKLNVDQLIQWINSPLDMGLPRILENLIIIIFAAHTNRVFFDGANSIEPNVEELKRHYELKEMDLPSEADWEKAIERAGHILGITQSPLLNAGNLAKFSDRVKEELSKFIDDSTNLLQTLEKVWTTRKELSNTAKRLATATNAKSFISEILETAGIKLVEKIASWENPMEPIPTDAAMGTSIKKASEVNNAILHTKWDVIETAEKLEGNLKEKSIQLVAAFKDDLEADELVTALAPKLKTIENNALLLIQSALKEKEAPGGKPPETEQTEPKEQPGIKIITEKQKDLSPEECKTEFDSILGLLNQENVRIDLHWRIYKISTDKKDK